MAAAAGPIPGTVSEMSSSTKPKPLTEVEGANGTQWKVTKKLGCTSNLDDCDVCWSSSSFYFKISSSFCDVRDSANPIVPFQ